MIHNLNVTIGAGITPVTCLPIRCNWGDICQNAAQAMTYGDLAAQM